jgi:glycosyltransferase involved in cell wall biosynthesis
MAATVEPNARAAVIVPTRNRPGSLARCLDALARQQGISGLELVVVDDGSLEPGRVRAAVGSKARLLRSERPRGPSAARNLGARAAAAPVLLFTDDDCEPAPDWAARMTEAVEAGGDVVAGLTENGRPDDPLASASETILEYVQDRARRSDSTTVFAATNNIACRAAVLAEIPFNEEYRYAEDRDWCARVRAAGCSLTVERAARVAHRQDLRLSTFLRQQFGYGRGAYRFRTRHESERRLEPPGFYAGLLKRGFSHGVLPGVLVGVAQGATAAGFIREALARSK